MKAAFYSLSVILAFTGLRCTNVLNNITAAVVCISLAVVCFYVATILDSLRNE